MEPRPGDFFHFQCSIHIDAPPERVWQYAGDLGRSAEWAGSGAVLAIRQVTSGPVGVGTRYVADEKMGFRFQSESEIRAYEPNQRIVWYVRPINMDFPEGRYHRWAFYLEPEDGGTRLTQEFRGTKATGLPRLMQRAAVAPFLRRFMLRGITRTMDTIRSMAEAPASTVQPVVRAASGQATSG